MAGFCMPMTHCPSCILVIRLLGSSVSDRKQFHGLRDAYKTKLRMATTVYTPEKKSVRPVVIKKLDTNPAFR
jgi:hypothetical protein